MQSLSLPSMVLPCKSFWPKATQGINSRTDFAIQGINLNFSIMKQGRLVPILNDCSLYIPRGQFWMLLGPNGCGKSTLLKILAGLIKPNHGTLNVQGPTGFVFQNPDHQVVMPTVETDCAFGLGSFDLTPDERPIQTLSGGQKQRVAIAGALAEASQVLLLDELTTFLDRHDQMGVINAVRSSKGGPDEVTVLWVTHRLEELNYADGAIYMEGGRVIMHGDIPSLRNFLRDRHIHW
ncbi:ABC transporter I family member 10 [Nymphaea thermarum]|nr:ABC transporter I family member 10 [Nymphaea thermarum]